jgi:DNA-directed RNA polymerase III subunit RPC2
MLSAKKSKTEEAIDILNRIILSHIDDVWGNQEMHFKAKTRFLSLMIRRILDAVFDPSKVDDKDYYGNKRLELAG